MKIKEITNEAENESLSSAYPLTLQTDDENEVSYRFRTDSKLLGDCSFWRKSKSGTWELAFSVGNTQDITDKGDAFKVFATVIESIRQFLTTPMGASMSELVIAAKADEPSRVRLYQRLAQSAPKVGLRYEGNRARGPYVSLVFSNPKNPPQSKMHQGTKMKIKEITNEAAKVTQVNPSTGEVTYKDDVTNVTTTVPQGAATPVAPGTTQINTAQLQTGQPGQTAQLGVKVGDTVKLGGTNTAGTTAPVAPTGTMGTTGTSETNVSETRQDLSPKSARYILRKIDGGSSILDLAHDFSELHTMYNDTALEYRLHPDDDFEKIEQIVINDLNDIADSDQDDEYYDTIDTSQEDEFEFESIKRLAGL